MEHKKINIPLNRAEGDLEIWVDISDGVVSNAWSSGTMYRGFERILTGRGALDGLVITPRICGICSTSHLHAAARALDNISNVTLPPNAIKIRNIAQIAEHIQSDIRHAFLMFAVDFVNPIYKNSPLFEGATRRYEPFKGQTIIQTIKETKKLIEIIAIIGGQWPHSSYMVPGGIVSMPSKSDLLQCRLLLKQFLNWYEERVLGCTLERFKEIKSLVDLNSWLEESNNHWRSDLGFFIRFSRAMGLDKIGHGHNSFINYGALDNFIPAGFLQNMEIQEFSESKINEHVAYSWYMDYEGGKHPFDGETRPYASGNESQKYSWAKAPRYDGFPAETGPLGEMVIKKHPLITDIINSKGISVFVRELARLIRTVELIPLMDSLLLEILDNGSFYNPLNEIIEGKGCGLTHASRGALGHWVKIKEGKIESYQIITPTAWNASPRDSNGIRGPIEEALIGTPVQDINNPIALGHVVRSFDVCLVCTVHSIYRGKIVSKSIIG
ncbi:MAG: nickel-dependent hydrogenase large subunit [Desulfobacterales bacterium]|nr:nickel-dependent hydrogenase large subunit [Desulfobacterales bacterium]MBF0398525.1 nickel-dependent hydrogenase large subunit [Desulfobacterales bacterium]